MPFLRQKVKSVLLIDFDNIDGHVGKAFGMSIENWTNWLEDGAFDRVRRQRNYVARKVYWNGRTDKKREAFESQGFEAFACRSQAANKIKANKSSADIVITIDAMDLVHEMSGLKEVILLTADTDFVPLVNRLQQKGLHVVVVGNEDDPSSAIFRERGAEVISVGALREACSYLSPAKKTVAAKPALPAVAPSPPQPPAHRATAPPANTQPPKRRSRSKQQQSKFDLNLAAQFVLEVAMQTPNRPVSRAAIEGALARVPGFTKSPTKENAAWLGCSNSDNLLKILAEGRPGLQVSRNPNGRAMQLKFVGDLPTSTEPAPEASQSPT